MDANKVDESRGRDAWIDNLKGIAMLGVVSVHLAGMIKGMPGWSLFLGRQGQLGVQLFIFASGFNVCRSLEREDVNCRWYVGKSVSLLIPAAIGIAIYWMLAYFDLCSYVNIKNYTAENIILNLFLLNNFFPASQNCILPGGWSISCIFISIVMAPFLYVLLSSDRRRAVTLVGCVSLVFISVALRFVYPKFDTNFCYWLITTQLMAFVFGILFWRQHKVHLRLSLFYRSILILFLLFLLEASQFYPSICYYSWPTIVGAILLFGLPLLPLARMRTWPILEAMGRHSFCFFILHFVVVSTIGCVQFKHYAILNFLIATIVVVFVTLGLAKVMDHLIVAPLNKVLKRVLGVHSYKSKELVQYK